jgi:hypothetical protein
LVATVVPSISGADVGAGPLRAGGDLVDLVEEHDAVLLDRGDRLIGHGLLIEQLVALLLDQQLQALAHRDAPLLGAPAEGLAQHVVQIDHAHGGARHAGDVHGRQLQACGVGQLDLDLLVVELAVAQAPAEGDARVVAGALADQGVDHALLGGQLRLGLDLLAQLLAGHVEGDLDQVAHDLLHVASDVADLGELGRLDLDEGGLGEPRRRAAPGAGRSRSCRRRSGRSSGCSWAAPPRAAPRAAAGGASGS